MRWLRLYSQLLPDLVDVFKAAGSVYMNYYNVYN
jgi:hypothetical protein